MEKFYPVDIKGQPTTITLVEWANTERLETLINTPRLDSMLLSKLKIYSSKHKVALNQYQIEYCYSKHAYNESGRLFARNHIGLQSFPRWVRSFLSDAYYDDLDCVASAPSIISNLLKQQSITNKLLDEYVADSKEFCRIHKVSKDDMLCALFDSKRAPMSEVLSTIWNDIYQRLVPILKEHNQNDYYKELWKHIQLKKNQTIRQNPHGAFVAFVTQTLENQILMEQMKFLEGMGFKVESLQFDGFLVRKDPLLHIGRCFKLVNEHVMQRLNMDIKVVVKPMVDYKPHLAKLQVRKEVVEELLNEGGEGSLGSYENLLYRSIGKPTHDKVATLLKFKMEDKVVHDGSHFWMFTTRWQQVLDIQIKQELTQKVLSELQERTQCDDKFEDLVAFMEDENKMTSVVNNFKTKVFDRTFYDSFDQDPLIIGCNNGYVNLTTGAFSTFNKDVRISKTTGYDYFDGDKVLFDQAVYQQWLDKVEQIHPIPEERRICQTYMGYMLRGDHPEKKFAMFKDDKGGNNGKSKQAQACSLAMGTYAKPGNNKHLYCNSEFQSQSGHNAEIFAYEGYRAAFFEEMDDKMELDTKKIKDHTGGNAKGSGRRPNGRVDETVNLFTKWALSFNDKCQPKYDTSDAGFLSRILGIPFRAKFYSSAKEYEASTVQWKHMADPDMDEKLIAWRPYILKWMLEGHQLYLQDGFRNIPQSCKDWVNQISKDVDQLEDWVGENLSKGSKHDIITLAQIKDLMTTAMKKRFKNNAHIISGLEQQLGSMAFKDTTIKGTALGDIRYQNGWRGWKIKSSLA